MECLLYSYTIFSPSRQCLIVLQENAYYMFRLCSDFCNNRILLKTKTKKKKNNKKKKKKNRFIS